MPETKIIELSESFKILTSKLEEGQAYLKSIESEQKKLTDIINFNKDLIKILSKQKEYMKIEFYTISELRVKFKQHPIVNRDNFFFDVKDAFEKITFFSGKDFLNHYKVVIKWIKKSINALNLILQQCEKQITELRKSNSTLEKQRVTLEKKRYDLIKNYVSSDSLSSQEIDATNFKMFLPPREILFIDATKLYNNSHGTYKSCLITANNKLENPFEDPLNYENDFTKWRSRHKDLLLKIK